ncbi:MAG: metalloprotease PmbA [Gammaproteobacteria bacterium]|nr:metalloprotease PmbA [Gammaproteobacteria bacterium]MBL6818864.1 metalloprotease PmbA [Gammaproteobacteria bacterium]MBL6898638.1 metalloprotease PmbA [Gammaproteobacteria bacterium]
MPNNFEETTKNLKEIIDNLDKKREYEFHFHSADGADVTSRFGDVENIQYHNDEALTVTCIDGKRKGVASTNNLSDESIELTIEKSKTIASFLETDKHQGLAKENLINEFDIDCGINFPKELSTEELINITIECEKSALEYDKRINNSEGSEYAYSQSNNLILNSHGAAGSYSSTSYTLSCVVIAEEEGLKERDYAYSTRRSFNQIGDPKTIGHESAKKAISRLGAKSISTRKCPIILTPELSVGLFSSFLSAINGNNIYKKNSFLRDFINKKVFSDHISISEQPNVKEGLGSRPFDSEGVITSDKLIVEGGVLNTYLLDTYSASQLSLKSTGNSGYSNILIDSTKPMMSKLVESIDNGILVTELMGSGANMLTGDYSRGAFGYLIENGKISYPVTNFTIASNMIEMFKNIEEIGNDYYLNSKIKCGSLMINDMTVGGN